MRIAALIVGILLGLLFLFASTAFFFGPPPPAMPEGTWIAQFMGATMPSGFMHFVKVCELLGGLLVAIPKTRNLGLLFLGPIILNILAFHVFITKGEGVLTPIIIAGAALFLLWVERKAWAGLVNRAPVAATP
jgi:putative oxidoreductase